MSRYIPADVRRKLRKEANFGCAICGAPIIEYHHIIPYSEKEHHDPDHMIALCPNHHRPSDDEAISRDELYYRKENPKNTNEVDYSFYFDSNIPIIEIGNVEVGLGEQGRCSILKIADTDIISVNYDSNQLGFDVNFYDKSGNLIAEISNNEWWADVESVWDMKYKSNWFKLWNNDKEVGLKIEYDTESDRISMKGKFYFEGDAFYVHPSKIIEPNGNRQISGSLGIIFGDDNNQFETAGTVLRRKLNQEEEVDTTLFHISHKEGEECNNPGELFYYK